MNDKKVSVKFKDKKGNNVIFNLEGNVDLSTLTAYLSSLGFFGDENIQLENNLQCILSSLS